IAGRCTLIRSTLNTIPNHQMQLSMLPSRTLQEIDKIQRDFLWGTTTEKKKIHLINWDKVTMPKEMGGLGIRKAKNKNLSLLTSLVWRLLNNHSSTWVRVISSCYNQTKSTNKASHTWKSLLKGWNYCKEGIRWPVDKNPNMSIWDTNWIPKFGSLRKNVIGPLNKKESELTLKYIKNQNAWDMSQFNLPINILNSIQSLTTSNNQDSTIVWSINTSGIFTTSSCYKLIDNNISDKQNYTGYNFDWIWKLECPRKIKFFIWKCCHSRLPTREYLGKIGVNIDTNFPICKTNESLLHIFWECKVEKIFWASIDIPFNSPRPQEHWVDFLRDKSPKAQNSLTNWKVAFPFVLWSIWNTRNENNSKNTANKINTSKVFKLALEYQLLATMKPNVNSSIKVKIKWHPPPKDWYKINIDGAFNEENMQGGISGVIRNNNGDWILGFNAKCESTSPIHSELLAFRQALHITMQGNFIPCKIETDATEVIRCLEEDYPTYKSLFDECRYLMEKLMERGETRMKHNFREGNKVAHLLAKEA
ncbi:putative ribonuclease h protein, partial [Nicotiana attenuata]